MKKFFFDCGTRESLTSLALLVLRACIGAMMLFGHGIPKIQGFSQYKDVFPVPHLFPLSTMSNPVALIFAIFAEVVASSLIILGIVTRPAAFVLAFTMVIAAFDIHSGAPFFLSPTADQAKEPAVLYLIPLLAVIIAGAGCYSLDAKIFKKRKSRVWG